MTASSALSLDEGFWPAAPLRDALIRSGLVDAECVAVASGHCATFALPQHELFVRVGRVGTEIQASQGIRFAVALHDRVPLLHPAVSVVDQPVMTRWGPVTFWPLLKGAVETFNYRIFGAMVRAIHDIRPRDVGIDFGHRRTPPSVAQARLHRFTRSELCTPRRAAAATQLLDDIHRLADEVLPGISRGLVHGDAYPDNVLTTPDGVTYLVDYDSAGIGPHYWDLAPIVVLHNRFGLPETDVESFFAGYGADPRDHPRFLEVVRIREWGVITPLLDRAGTEPAYVAELDRRIETRFQAGELWTASDILESPSAGFVDTSTETREP